MDEQDLKLQDIFELEPDWMLLNIILWKTCYIRGTQDAMVRSYG